MHGVEADNVDRTGLAESVGTCGAEIGVVAFEDPVDSTVAATQVARKPRVVSRWWIPDGHLVAHPERRGRRTAPRRVTLPQVADDLVVDRLAVELRKGRGRILAVTLAKRVKLTRCEIAAIDQVRGDAAQPFLVVPVLEVGERIHRLGALTQIRPRPRRGERGGHLVEVVTRQRVPQRTAQPHQRDMKPEDPPLPILDEDSFLEIEGAVQPFETSQVVLEFHKIISWDRGELGSVLGGAACSLLAPLSEAVKCRNTTRGAP
jgi:hypothetical protein